MSESNQEHEAVAQRPFSVGEALTVARKAKKIDVDDVCAYLRLSQRQVIALENNDFSVLPEATITRGFIRNYARMLALDPEPLLHAYAAFSATTQPQSISIPSANIQMPGNGRRLRKRYLFVSALIVLLVVAWMIFMDDSPEKSSEPGIAPLASQDAAENAEEDTLVLDLPELSAPEAKVDTQQEVESASVSLDAGTEAGAVTSEPSAIAGASGRGEIRIKSTEHSWVRITDAGNNKVFDKILATGVEEVLEGQPPFQVIIGNAPSTTLVFNQKTVDLAPLTGSDKVARLKLE